MTAPDLLTMKSLNWPGPDMSRLVPIPSPFHVAGPSILRELEQEPEQGERILLIAAGQVRDAIARIADSQAEGIVYCVFGATPEHMSPMMYGGHFLELDRQLLSEAAPFRLTFVVGGEGTYLDCVSDLPGEAFGWDVQRTGLNVEAMRAMRAGALAATDPSADLILSTDVDDLSEFLEQYTFVL